ncbi:hypothetical protein HK101_006169 [Irineochytrium annulatum]|nr:hypothetical protein HK101_006169 [Irineochytrium annulatum]
MSLEDEDLFYTPAPKRKSKGNGSVTGLDGAWSPRTSVGSSGGSSVNGGGRALSRATTLLSEFEHMRGAGRVLSSSSEGEGGSESDDFSELARLTRMTVDLTRRLQEKERELVSTHKYSEHRIVELEDQVQRLKGEIAAKKRVISDFKNLEEHHGARVEEMERQVERLQNDLDLSKAQCMQLRRELEKRNELAFKLSDDLKWKEKQMMTVKTENNFLECTLKQVR